jgi:hypothetical protein
MWLSVQSQYDRHVTESAMRAVLDRIKPCALPPIQILRLPDSRSGAAS